MARRARWPRAVAIGLALLTTAVARGQAGSEGGPQGSGAAGGTSSDPIGEAVPLGEPDNSSGGGQDGFGGTTGGRGRSGGTAGAPSLGNLGPTPGDPNDGRLGAPIGASGTAGFDNDPSAQRRLLGRRAGPAGVPTDRQGGTGPPKSQRLRGRQLARRRDEVEPPDSDPTSLASRPGQEIPVGPEDPGPPDGLTLDAAVDRLVARNLDLLALQFEIPKAEADILTAGLRSNPIIYADASLIPYGHYSNIRPGGGGGQPQYDVNLSLPLDLSGKRKARVAVAERAKRVTEAQLQDSARTLIADLYEAYVNVLAARETLRFGEAYSTGIARILAKAEADRDRARQAEDAAGDDEVKKKEAERASEDAREAVVALRNRARQGTLQVRQAARALANSTRTLAQLLDVPPTQAEGLRVRDRLRVVRPLPAPAESLIAAAIDHRPDLAAYRLGVRRADADVGLAKANRFPDLYVLYQPYTLQGGRAAGLKGTYSYALGVNASLPLFNRNQGNIARAEWNARQTRAELVALEQRVAHEVAEATLDVERSGLAVLEAEREVVPAAAEARDDAFKRYRDDPSKVGDYLDEQDDYDQVIQQYRNALIEHRRCTLELNTTVGIRVLP